MFVKQRAFRAWKDAGTGEVNVQSCSPSDPLAPHRAPPSPTTQSPSHSPPPPPSPPPIPSPPPPHYHYSPAVVAPGSNSPAVRKIFPYYVALQRIPSHSFWQKSLDSSRASETPTRYPPLPLVPPIPVQHSERQVNPPRLSSSLPRRSGPSTIVIADRRPQALRPAREGAGVGDPRVSVNPASILAHASSEMRGRAWMKQQRASMSMEELLAEGKENYRLRLRGSAYAT
eukprot:768504-Hanusia_phi.AAC.4